MLILGIDPGASGAIAGIGREGELFYGDFSSDPSVLAEAFRTMLFWCKRLDEPAVAAIEAVHSMPKQGVASSFSFGASYGACRGILAYAEVPYHLVTPSKWKKDLGLGKDKDEALAMARRLFPTAELSRKKDIGRAEALLIAEWARRFVVKH